jgi:hypothetical protein
MVSVKVTERVPVSAGQVWEIFRDFGGVRRFTPQIEQCTVEGEGVGAVRTITMPGGLQIQERLEALDEAARTLSYAIVSGPAPFRDYLATIRVSEDGDGCTIDWSSHFEPQGVSEEQARAIVEGIYQGGIAGLRKHLGA